MSLEPSKSKESLEINPINDLQLVWNDQIYQIIACSKQSVKIFQDNENEPFLLR